MHANPPVPSVQVGAVPTLIPAVGTEIALLNTIGLVAVPATAGQVSVADPLVPPWPVITQAVVFAKPQPIESPERAPLKVPAAAVSVPVVVGEAENITFPVPVAPPAVTPPMEMLVPKVWSADQD